ncbi:hypothetical protein MCR_0811 [Moraxella catarrhalis BBH18]|nr:hypothetical protein MCR_0811 [Moraxella catarrhalis BBH18]
MYVQRQRAMGVKRFKLAQIQIHDKFAQCLSFTNTLMTLVFSF